MRPLLAFTLLILIAACTPSADVTSGSSTTSVNAEAPFIWGNKTFPKTINISSSFTADESAVMTEMATAWKTAVANQKTFFAIGTPGNNNYNINDTDGVFGIYKATTWPTDVSEDALAITQLFGRRYNVGTADEYVSIVEADILVNYKPGTTSFEFDILDNGIDEGFDLRTIILHEMGHFLGLQHIPTYYDRPEADSHLSRDAYKATSVMYPSISSIEEKRVPKTKDINTLVNKYNIGGGAAAIAVASNRYSPKDDDLGKNIKVVIELKASGECTHKEDGVVLRRHHIKLKELKDNFSSLQ